MNQRRIEKLHPDGQYTDHLSMGRAFFEWYPKFTPNIITIHFDFWTVSDKIAATVIIGFIVVKITQAWSYKFNKNIQNKKNESFLEQKYCTDIHW